MEINVTNTARGFVPCEDSDYEKKQKLKIGEVYKMKLTLNRNYEFHKKFWALIRCAWEYQPEAVVAFYHNDIDSFQRTVCNAAGQSEKQFSLQLGHYVDVYKSISFESMDELAFRDLYERVKDVLFASYLSHISKEDFDRNLINF